MHNGRSCYARHPQYTGLVLVILAFLVRWPTLLMVLMAPVLVGGHLQRAQREEVAMRAQFGVQYDGYARQVAAFFPPLSRWKEFFKANTLPNVGGA